MTYFFSVGDVVEIYLGTKTNGNDGNIVKIVVTRNVVTGKISKISSDEKKVTIDGKDYTTYDGTGVKTYAGNALSVTAAGYNFYLNAVGDIVAVEPVETVADYAIVIATGSTGAGWTDGADSYGIKLFTAEGEVKSFTVKEAVAENLEKAGTLKMSEWDDTTNGLVGAVVKYTTTEDGDVNYIGIAKYTKWNEDGGTVGTKKSIDGKYIASDAVVIIASDAYKANAVDVTSTSPKWSLKLGTIADIVGKEYTDIYYTESGDKIDYIVITLDDSIKPTTGIYAGWATVVVDGAACEELYFYEDGEKVTYNAATGFHTKHTVDGVVGIVTFTGEKVASFTTGGALSVTSVCDKNDKYKNNTWKNNAIAEDAVVYLVKDGAVSVKDTSLFTSSTYDGKTITLYDVDLPYFTGDVDDKGDNVYEIVVINY